MVNQSKIKQQRFWDKWENAGATGINKNKIMSDKRLKRAYQLLKDNIDTVVTIYSAILEGAVIQDERRFVSYSGATPHSLHSEGVFGPPLLGENYINYYFKGDLNALCEYDKLVAGMYRDGLLDFAYFDDEASCLDFYTANRVLIERLAGVTVKPSKEELTTVEKVMKNTIDVLATQPLNQRDPYIAQIDTLVRNLYHRRRDFLESE